LAGGPGRRSPALPNVYVHRIKTKEKNGNKRIREEKGQEGLDRPNASANRRSPGTSRRPHNALGTLGLLLRSDQRNKGSDRFKYTFTIMLDLAADP
jgi:hypothetical protein